MNITTTKLVGRTTPKPVQHQASSHESAPTGDKFTFSGGTYPPISVGGAVPLFGACMNLIGASDADPHGRTDLVRESIGGAVSNLAGTGLLAGAFLKGSLAMGALGVGLLGVSGFIAGHVFSEMP